MFHSTDSDKSQFASMLKSTQVLAVTLTLQIECMASKDRPQTVLAEVSDTKSYAVTKGLVPYPRNGEKSSPTTASDRFCPVRLTSIEFRWRNVEPSSENVPPCPASSKPRYVVRVRDPVH